MRHLIHQHTISFKHAVEGLLWAFKSQPNFRVHFILSVLVVLASWFFEITTVEFSIIIFTIVLGFTGELLNTALESITDLVTTEWREEAKIAKDVAAGMMLFIAIGSVFIAIVILGPYIFN